MNRPEELPGAKPDMEELREVKVKLPLRHLLKLHYVKLTSNRTFSDVVAEALHDYFADLREARTQPQAP